jgi:hypothetical protein
MPGEPPKTHTWAAKVVTPRRRVGSPQHRRMGTKTKVFLGSSSACGQPRVEELSGADAQGIPPPVCAPCAAPPRRGGAAPQTGVVLPSPSGAMCRLKLAPSISIAPASRASASGLFPPSPSCLQCHCPPTPCCVCLCVAPRFPHRHHPDRFLHPIQTPIPFSASTKPACSP